MRIPKFALPLLSGLALSFSGFSQNGNRPSTALVYQARNVDAYQRGALLASFSDPDGPIVQATLMIGALPNGTSLHPVTGDITVTNPAVLLPGTFSLNVRVTDSRNSRTNLSITLRILPDAEAMILVFAPRSASSYQEQDTLLTFTDADGPIVSALLISGTLPEGTRLDTINGNLLVTDPARLQASTWNFTIATRDMTGGGSVIPVSYTFEPLKTLPVNWKSFTAVSREDEVELRWTTATEENNAYFEVQRSADGRDFSPLAKITGAGTSNKAQTYTFTDRQPRQGVSYYRLRQVDTDGKYAYSQVVAVRQQTAAQLYVYPQPASGAATLDLRLPQDEQFVLQLYTVAGELVYSTRFSAAAGRQQVQLQTESLSKGTYLLRLTGQQTHLRQQLIVQ